MKSTSVFKSRSLEKMVKTSKFASQKENNNCTRKLSNVRYIKSEIYSFRVSVNRERILFKRRQFILLEQLVIR